MCHHKGNSATYKCRSDRSVIIQRSLEAKEASSPFYLEEDSADEHFDLEKASTFFNATAFREGDTRSPALTKYLNNFMAIVTTGEGKPIVATRKTRNHKCKLSDFDAFKASHGAHILSGYYTSVKMNENKQLQYTEKRLETPMFALWNKQYSRITFNRIIFNPASPGDDMEKMDLNIFRGFAAKEVEDVNMDLIEPFLWHIEHILCSSKKSYTHHVTGWMADIFQKAARKTGTAIHILGPQGAGKGVICAFLCYIIGDDHFFSTQSKFDILDKYNGDQEGVLLSVGNEIAWGGYLEANNIIKGLNTEQKQNTQRKYQDRRKIDDYRRFIFTSNEDWSVTIDDADEERRSIILRAASIKIGDKAYFDKLTAVMESEEGRDHFYTYLLRYDYSDVNLRMALLTEEKKAVARLSMTPLQRFAADWVDEQVWENQIVDAGTTASFKTTGTKVLYSDYKRWCEYNCIKSGQMIESQFGQHIRKLTKYIKIENVLPIDRKGPEGQAIKITKVRTS